MLRRLDHFLDLIGRPEERRQTDDDTDDDGQQIAARGLRRPDSLARSPESDVKTPFSAPKGILQQVEKMVTSR